MLPPSVQRVNNYASHFYFRSHGNYARNRFALTDTRMIFFFFHLWWPGEGSLIEVTVALVLKYFRGLCFTAITFMVQEWLACWECSHTHTKPTHSAIYTAPVDFMWSKEPVCGCEGVDVKNVFLTCCGCVELTFRCPQCMPARSHICRKSWTAACSMMMYTATFLLKLASRRSLKMSTSVKMSMTMPMSC